MEQTHTKLTSEHLGYLLLFLKHLLNTTSEISSMLHRNPIFIHRTCLMQKQKAISPHPLLLLLGIAAAAWVTAAKQRQI